MEVKGETLSPGQMASARSLQVDLVTAEVGRAMAAAGVRLLLLKGPSLARLLYGDGASRPYFDSDLLVDPDQRQAAEAVLEQLGFQPILDDSDTPGWRQAAYHWSRPADSANVDLHRTLIGVGVTPDALWPALAMHSHTMRLAGVTVDVLDRVALAFHVALHAAQHGARIGRTLEDLRRGLALLDEPTWREAADLARELDAIPAFACGLRLLQPGRELAARLMLPAGLTVEAQLRATSPPAAAMGFALFARAPDAATRCQFAAGKLIPTRRFMRTWSPLANQGRLGLGAAYVGRPLWLAARAPRGFFAWRRARRAVR